MAWRSPSFLTSGTLTTADHPFLSSNIGYIPANPADPPEPAGSGINNTLLASATGGGAGTAPMFQAPSVAAKVGYFRVIQDTDPITGAPVRPVKLGEEFGSTTGTAVRHQTPRPHRPTDR